MTTKSIIGCKYVANGMKAIDLNLRQEVALGMNHKYTIIADPYVCEYYRPAPLDFSPRKVKMMAVNVLDDRTGLTYAVEYHPANLVCEDRRQINPKRPSISLPAPSRSPMNSKLCSILRGGEFPTNAALRSLRFRTTETIKHRLARAFSAVEEIWLRRLSPRLVPRIQTSLKS